MKLGWEAMGSGVMCEGSPYRSWGKNKEWSGQEED